MCEPYLVKTVLCCCLHLLVVKESNSTPTTTSLVVEVISRLHLRDVVRLVIQVHLLKLVTGNSYSLSSLATLFHLYLFAYTSVVDFYIKILRIYMCIRLPTLMRIRDLQVYVHCILYLFLHFVYCFTLTFKQPHSCT